MNIQEKDTKGFLENTKNFLKTEEELPPDEYSFNAFNLSSDFYYMENFHSNIISAFLDINGPHQEGNKFLFLFLDFLSKYSNKIKKENYSDAKVLREKGKLDILIIGNEHCIIFENKINNAEDQNLQIPRYCKYCEEKNLNVDAVFYLSLYGLKEPCRENWDERFKKMEIVNVAAFDGENKQNFYNNWIIPSILKSSYINTREILSQYAKLIKYLTRKVYMENETIKYYDEILSKDKNIEIAQKIKIMLENMPQAMCRKIFEQYRTLTVFFESPIAGKNFVVFRHKLKLENIKKNVTLEYIKNELTEGIYLKTHIGWNSDTCKFYIELWYNEGNSNPEAENPNIDIKKDFENDADLKEHLKYFKYNQVKYSIIKEFDTYNDLTGNFNNLCEKLKKYYE